MWWPPSGPCPPASATPWCSASSRAAPTRRSPRSSVSAMIRRALLNRARTTSRTGMTALRRSRCWPASHGVRARGRAGRAGRRAGRRRRRDGGGDQGLRDGHRDRRRGRGRGELAVGGSTMGARGRNVGPPPRWSRPSRPKRLRATAAPGGERPGRRRAAHAGSHERGPCARSRSPRRRPTGRARPTRPGGRRPRPRRRGGPRRPPRPPRRRARRRPRLRRPG